MLPPDLLRDACDLRGTVFSPVYTHDRARLHMCSHVCMCVCVFCLYARPTPTPRGAKSLPIPPSTSAQSIVNRIGSSRPQVLVGQRKGHQEGGIQVLSARVLWVPSPAQGTSSRAHTLTCKQNTGRKPLTEFLGYGRHDPLPPTSHSQQG